MSPAAVGDTGILTIQSSQKYTLGMVDNALKNIHGLDRHGRFWKVFYPHYCKKESHVVCSLFKI